MAKPYRNLIGSVTTAPLHPDAPDFDPDAWNKDSEVDVQATNCFQYAYAGKIPPVKLNKSTPDPGETSGNLLAADTALAEESGLLKALKLDHIEIVSKTLPPPKKGSYIVGLYYEHGQDFHWVRQDSDGGWSQKPGTGTAVQRYIEPSPDGNYQPLPEQFYKTAYRLVGYAYVPKEGVSLGLEKYLAHYLASHKGNEAGLDATLRDIPYMKVQMIQKALDRDHPREALLFAETVNQLHEKEVEGFAPSLREGKMTGGLKKIFDDAAKFPLEHGRVKAYAEILEQKHPELVKTYYDAEATAAQMRKAKLQVTSTPAVAQQQTAAAARSAATAHHVL